MRWFARKRSAPPISLRPPAEPVRVRRLTRLPEIEPLREAIGKAAGDDAEREAMTSSTTPEGSRGASNRGGSLE